MYIADTSNHRIRKVTASTGIITTLAGTGMSSFSGDNGPASSATLYHPTSIALDSAGTSFAFFFSLYLLISSYHLGNVYIADQYNNRIRKVTISTGIITTYAGTGSTSFSGDNGPATSAALYYPYGIALDLEGTGTYSLIYFLV